MVWASVVGSGAWVVAGIPPQVALCATLAGTFGL